MTRKKMIKITIEAVLFISIVIGFVLINDQITQNKRSSFVPLNDSNAFAYQIEDFSINEDTLVIKGWFFEVESIRKEKREVDSNKTLKVLLYDMNSTMIDADSKTKRGISTTTTKVKRYDIDQYFKCEFDYSSCGFVSKIEKDSIDLEKGDYQIIIKPDEDADYGVLVNAYISKGKLMYVDPNVYLELEQNGADIIKLIDEGICLVSCPEHHIYVFQHGKSLLWVADKNYCFEKNGKTFIQYQIDTTQFDKLPRNRVENGWYWDNKGANFEDYEVTDLMECSNYRVYKRDLPTDYSITRIETGYNADGKWVWHSFFRPIYSQINQ